MNKALSYILIFAGIQILATVLVNAVLQFSGHGELIDSPYKNIVAMIIFAMVTAFVFIKAGWAAPDSNYLMSRPWIVISWSVIAAMGAVLPSMAFQEQMPELPNIVEEEMTAIINAHGGYFVVCLLVPLVEELVFRGAILRVLLQWKSSHPWSMIIISALLFSLIHMNPAQMPHAFIIGILLGWMYYRTRSIVPGVAFHWANNTIAVVLARLYPDPNIHLIDIFGTQRTVAAAVLFSLFILIPAIYQLHLWMKPLKK